MADEGSFGRVVSFALAAAAAVAAAAAIATVVSGDLGETDARTLGSLVAVFLCGGAAIAGVQLIDRRERSLGAAVLAATPAVLVVFLLGIWKGEFGDGSNDWFKLIPIGFAWAVAVVVVATLPLIARPVWPAAILAPAVAACAVGGAALATVLVWGDVNGEAWEKALAVLAILMVAGYVATPSLVRVQASPGRSPGRD